MADTQKAPRKPGPNETAVRLTMWPDRDHVVRKDELPGLRSQCLLIEPDAAETAAETAGGSEDPGGQPASDSSGSPDGGQQAATAARSRGPRAAS